MMIFKSTVKVYRSKLAQINHSPAAHLLDAKTHVYYCVLPQEIHGQIQEEASIHPLRPMSNKLFTRAIISAMCNREVFHVSLGLNQFCKKKKRKKEEAV